MSEPTLSERELQVAEMLADGCTNRDIAAKLGVTEQIVKNVIHRLFNKCGMWNRMELANCLANRKPSNGKQDAPTQEALARIEEERLRVLRDLNILDTAAERAFDELTRLACSICRVPISLISLVDSDRLWFKSKAGLSASQVRRVGEFCVSAIKQSEVLVVGDALDDPCLSTHPLVTSELKLRFYAGAPIITGDGYAVGTLCVIDRTPRKLSAEQLAALKSLAWLALEQMELRKKILQLRPKVA
jgi:DNA-binding CsgD family transcriptional regulator